MACIVMAYIVMVYIVMACIVMAYIVMAYTGMAHARMPYIVMAFIVMASGRTHWSRSCTACSCSQARTGPAPRRTPLPSRRRTACRHGSDPPSAAGTRAPSYIVMALYSYGSDPPSAAGTRAPFGILIMAY